MRGLRERGASLSAVTLALTASVAASCGGDGGPGAVAERPAPTTATRAAAPATAAPQEPVPTRRADAAERRRAQERRRDDGGRARRPAPKERSPAPKERSPAPKERSPAPKERSPAVGEPLPQRPPKQPSARRLPVVAIADGGCRPRSVRVPPRASLSVRNLAGAGARFEVPATGTDLPVPVRRTLHVLLPPGRHAFVCHLGGDRRVSGTVTVAPPRG